MLQLKHYLSQNTANLIDINQVDIEMKEVILRAAEVLSAIRIENLGDVAMFGLTDTIKEQAGNGPSRRHI